MQYRFLPAILPLLCVSPAIARDYCPERPGLGTPACTMAPGSLSVEVAGADWTRDDVDDARTDTLLLGDMLLRYGVADHGEIRLGWTPWGQERLRDRATGAVDRSRGTGDVTVGIKRNLIDPSGDGVSVALLGAVSLPTGGQAIGAGDWGASLAMPFSVPVSSSLSFGLTPEVDAAVDADRNGRHVAYGLAGGLTFAPADAVALALEVQAVRDDDPDGATTELLAGLSAGVMVGEAMQIDIGSAFGLNRDSPDGQVYVGISRRF